MQPDAEPPDVRHEAVDLEVRLIELFCDLLAGGKQQDQPWDESSVALYVDSFLGTGASEGRPETR